MLIRLLTIGLLAGVLAWTGSPTADLSPLPMAASAPGAAAGKRVVILGVDGLDPHRLRHWMRAGELPNFAALARDTGPGWSAHFRPLQTVDPPQSPVAWATFATGTDPGHHGLFGFVHRDPATYRPLASMTRVYAPEWAITLGDTRLPLDSATTRNQRRGTTWWQVLTEAGVPATVLDHPTTFPPGQLDACCGRLLSGMGTPDLLGTAFGQHRLFLEVDADDLPLPLPTETALNPEALAAQTYGASGYPTPRRPADSGARDRDSTRLAEGAITDHNPTRRAVRFDANGHARAQLLGPPSPYDAEPHPATLPILIRRDPQTGEAGLDGHDQQAANDGDESIAIEVGGRLVVLGVGQWSAWETVEFPLGGLPMTVRGMVQFHLASARPLRLYVTPVNIDPRAPASAISSPESYAPGLADAVGPFATETIPEDIHALETGALDRDAFLQQLHARLDEQEAKLRYELARHEAGVLFLHLSGVDIVQHMFERERASGDLADLPWRSAILDVHRRVDAMLGQVRQALAASTPPGAPRPWLMVISDHGFAPFRRQADVNRWLLENGYLVRHDAQNPPSPAARADGTAGAVPGAPFGIDWSRTRAFALGLNGLYINEAGREARGIVAPADVPALKAELRARLLAWRDPDPLVNRTPLDRVATDGTVIRDLIDTRRTYPTADPLVAPDLLLGFARGYRHAWRSVEGGLGPHPLSPNNHRWSGDHCISAREVPGTLLSTRPLPAGVEPSLAMLAPALIAFFGAQTPPQMAAIDPWRTRASSD